MAARLTSFACPPSRGRVTGAGGVSMPAQAPARRPLPYRGELDVDGVVAGQEQLGVPKLGHMLLFAPRGHYVVQEHSPWHWGVHGDDRGQVWEPGGREDGESGAEDGPTDTPASSRGWGEGMRELGRLMTHSS